VDRWTGKTNGERGGLDGAPFVFESKGESCAILVRVEPTTKRLVDAGPAPAAVAA
jgi:hypothetical protein